MANLSDDFVPVGARRLRRQQRRRHRQVALSILGVAAAIAVALVLTDTVRIPGGEGPAIAASDNAGSPRSSRNVVHTSPSDPDEAPRRPLTSEAPLNLWIGGDSLSGALGYSLGNSTAKTGVVQPSIDTHVSSGLRGQVLNWQKRAASEMAALDPDAVVFIVGANDSGAVTNFPKDPTGQPAWRANYAKLVASMMDTFIGGARHRAVYWIGAPITKDTKWAAAMRELNAVFKEEAAKRPDVVFIDAYELFSDDAGRYADSLPDFSGKTVRVRGGDGIHFTTAGGDRLAAVVYQVIDDQWHLNEQAVLNHTKPVRQRPGSSQKVPGVSSSRIVTSTPRATSSTSAATPTTRTSPSSSSSATTSTSAVSTTTTVASTTTAPTVTSPPTSAPESSTAPPTTPPT